QLRHTREAALDVRSEGSLPRGRRPDERVPEPVRRAAGAGARAPGSERGIMKVRRVVTGQVDGGKSVFVSDEEVEPVTLSLIPGAEFHRLWGADQTVQLPTDGSLPPHRDYFPPAGGFRWGFFTLPAAGGMGLPEGFDIAAALQEMEEKLPGMAGHM